MSRKLLICSPAKGGLPAFYLKLQHELFTRPIEGWAVEWLVEGANSALQMSRNILANEAMRCGFDRCLMMDTDHPVTREHIVRILSHDHDAVPIVSGLYCLKRPGNPFFLGVRQKGAEPDKETGLLPAEFLPTGFLSVSTAALRTMAAYHKDRQFYVHDDSALPDSPQQTRAIMTELFPVAVCGPRTPAARLKRVREALAPAVEKGVGALSRGVVVNVLNEAVKALTEEHEPGALLGEDYHFTWLAREAGIPCFIDTHLLIPHRGAIDYPITDPAMLATSCQAIPEAKADLTKW